MPKINEHDLGLRMYSFDMSCRRQIAGEPWSIGAHPTYFSSTENGYKFSEFIGKYIAFAYNPNLLTNWTIDQCAIARAYDLLIRPNHSIKVIDFSTFDTISHLPSSSKTEFLHEGGLVTLENFWDRTKIYV